MPRSHTQHCANLDFKERIVKCWPSVLDSDTHGIEAIVRNPSRTMVFRLENMKYENLNEAYKMHSLVS